MRHSFTTTVIANNIKSEKSFVTETTRYDVMERFEWLFPFLGTTLEAVNAVIIAEEVATLSREDYATDEDYIEAYVDAVASSTNDGYELSLRLHALLESNPSVNIYDSN